MSNAHIYPVGTRVQVIKEWAAPETYSHVPVGTDGTIVRQHPFATDYHTDPLYTMQFGRAEQQFSESNILTFLELLPSQLPEPIKYDKNIRFTHLVDDVA